jgi:hypothetical protein
MVKEVEEIIQNLTSKLDGISVKIMEKMASCIFKVRREVKAATGLV